MIAIGVTFAFSVYTFYTLYECLTSLNDEVLRQVTAVNTIWYFFYMTISFLVICIGSSVEDEVKFLNHILKIT